MNNKNNASYIKNITIPSEWGAEKKVLVQLDNILSSHAFLEEDCFDLKTAVSEACLNAIEHGNHLNPQLFVSITLTLKKDTVIVDVCDQGTGFSTMMQSNHTPSMVQYRNDRGPATSSTDNRAIHRGWGLLFIQNLVDEWALYCKKEPQTFGIYMKKIMRKIEMGEDQCKRS